MTLSKKDWINVGTGHLYCAPFMSRFLLFRLFDTNSSLLVYHSKSYTSSTISGDSEAMVSMSTVSWPTDVLAHFSSSSALLTLQQLLNLPSVQLKLSESTVTEQIFGKVKLHLEHYSAPISRKRIKAAENGELNEFNIIDSMYRVTGKVHMSNWPARIPLDGIGMSCWKISISNSKSIAYDLKSNNNWNLTAFEMENNLPATLKMHLESKLRQPELSD